MFQFNFETHSRSYQSTLLYLQKHMDFMRARKEYVYINLIKFTYQETLCKQKTS